MSTAPTPHIANPATRTLSIGCVSFLNARPLIDGVANWPDVHVDEAVPSALLTDLEAGRTDIALCPVIDFQTSRLALRIVPVGGIGCDGPTCTVRLFSKTPIDQIMHVHADTDSHTSVILLQVLLHELYGVRATIHPFDARHDTAAPHDTMLLIGDKVAIDPRAGNEYPHQLDLGQAWCELTGLPFVFAVWMTPRDVDLADLPQRLDQVRRHNTGRIDEIVDRFAPPLNWPRELAREYLGERLRYDIAGKQLEAMQLFWFKAHDQGLIKTLRPVEVYV